MCWQFLGWSMFLSHIPQVWGRHPWFTSSVIRRCSAVHLGPWGAQWKSRQASLHARVHTLLWRGEGLESIFTKRERELISQGGGYTSLHDATNERQLYEEKLHEETVLSKSLCRLLNKASHLTAFYALYSSLHLPVTPAQLMRPGIGRNTSCAVGDFA